MSSGFGQQSGGYGGSPGGGYGGQNYGMQPQYGRAFQAKPMMENSGLHPYQPQTPQMPQNAFAGQGNASQRPGFPGQGNGYGRRQYATDAQLYGTPQIPGVNELNLSMGAQSQRPGNPFARSPEQQNFWNGMFGQADPRYPSTQSYGDPRMSTPNFVQEEQQLPQNSGLHPYQPPSYGQQMPMPQQQPQAISDPYFQQRMPWMMGR